MSGSLCFRWFAPVINKAAPKMLPIVVIGNKWSKIKNTLTDRPVKFRPISFHISTVLKSTPQ